MKIIKSLVGHSGSIVQLIENDKKKVVRKTKNIERNLEKYESLKKLNILCPKIINRNNNYYEMEYINGINMQHYLLNYGSKDLIIFIENLLNKLNKNVKEKDFSDAYIIKLKNFNYKKYNLNFNFEDIFNKLPKKIFSSEYLGDLTLENILYDVNKNNFFIIDQSITEYDSYVFDIAKLKQDTVCKWFIRNDLINLDKELNEINIALSKYEYYNNDYLLIIMLMRVLPYCKKYEDVAFLKDNINLLWSKLEQKDSNFQPPD